MDEHENIGTKSLNVDLFRNGQYAYAGEMPRCSCGWFGHAHNAYDTEETEILCKREWLFQHYQKEKRRRKLLGN